MDILLMSSTGCSDEKLMGLCVFRHMWIPGSHPLTRFYLDC